MAGNAVFFKRHRQRIGPGGGPSHKGRNGTQIAIGQARSEFVAGGAGQLHQIARAASLRPVAGLVPGCHLTVGPSRRAGRCLCGGCRAECQTEPHVSPVREFQPAGIFGEGSKRGVVFVVEAGDGGVTGGGAVGRRLHAGAVLGDLRMAGGAGLVGNAGEIGTAALMIGVAGSAGAHLGGNLPRIMDGHPVAGLAGGVGGLSGERRGQPSVVADGRERLVAGLAVLLPGGMHVGHGARRVVPRLVPGAPRTPANSQQKSHQDQPAAGHGEMIGGVEVGAVDPRHLLTRGAAVGPRNGGGRGHETYQYQSATGMWTANSTPNATDRGTCTSSQPWSQRWILTCRSPWRR